MFRILRIILFVLMVAGLLYILYFLFNQHFAFQGVMKVNYNFKEKSPIITELVPNVRVGEVEKDEWDYYQPVNIDPVYFNLIPPVEYDFVNVCMTYATSDTSVLYFGAQYDEGFNYDILPLENKTLDKIIADSNWETIKGNSDVLLLQNQSAPYKYQSVDEFFNELPSSENLAVFNYDLDFEYRIKDYQKKDEGIVIDTTLRGPHTMITYVEDEPLEMTFSIQDMNRHEGKDEFEVVVLRNGQGLYSKTLEDDGFVLATDPGSARRIRIYMDNLEPGAYTVDLHTNQDIFIRQIKTNQSYLVFKNNLYLVDNIEYKDGMLDLNYLGNNLYTKGDKMSFRTTHKSGLQVLNIDDGILDLDETHKLFYYSADPELEEHVIQVPYNDVVVHAGGLVSFDKSHYFNPNLISIDENTNNIPNSTKYIIAEYEEPEKLSNDVRKACRHFFFDDYYLEKGKLKFIISAPGLEINNNVIKMYDINATFVRQPFESDDYWNIFSLNGGR